MVRGSAPPAAARLLSSQQQQQQGAAEHGAHPSAAWRAERQSGPIRSRLFD
eukprot:gene21896-65230_t